MKIATRSHRKVATEAQWSMSAIGHKQTSETVSGIILIIQMNSYAHEDSGHLGECSQRFHQHRLAKGDANLSTRITKPRACLR